MKYCKLKKLLYYGNPLVIVGNRDAKTNDMLKIAKKTGRAVSVLNLGNPGKSNRYNPFEYVNTFNDMEQIAEALADPRDPRRDMQITLAEALISYLRTYQKTDRQNMGMVYKLLGNSDRDPRTMKSKLDAVFDEVRAINPDDECVRLYDTLKNDYGREREQTAAHLMSILRAYADKDMVKMTAADRMDLRGFAGGNRIIFIIRGTEAQEHLVRIFFRQLDKAVQEAGNAQDVFILRYPFGRIYRIRGHESDEYRPENVRQAQMKGSMFEQVMTESEYKANSDYILTPQERQETKHREHERRLSQAEKKAAMEADAPSRPSALRRDIEKKENDAMKSYAEKRADRHPVFTGSGSEQKQSGITYM